MVTSPPEAYDAAMALSPDLRRRFDNVRKRLARGGHNNKLRAFTSTITQGAAAINMSIERLNIFLESGEWLNIYEAVLRDTGKTGHEFDEEVERRLGEWYRPRRTIDTLFKFSLSTHYAALNLGGAGPRHYGICCVELNLRHWSPFHTCFGGDSIRACFDSKLNKVREDSEILQWFGIGRDIHRVAAIMHQDYLEGERPGLDRSELRAILEASNSPIEFHLHGPVTRDSIIRVMMSRADRDSLWELAERSSRMRKPWPQEYDAVPHFFKLVKLLDTYKIPLVLPEGS